MTTQEALKLLQSGQGKNLTQTPKQNSFLGSIISGIVDPFTRLSGSMAENSRKRYLQNKGEDISNYTANYMKKEDFENYKNPLNVIKDLASAGSLFIPGAGIGKGIMGAAKAGATAGAMGGFGSTYGKDSIEDTLLGTAGGALTGAGLGVAGGLLSKGGQKLANKGGDVVEKIGKQSKGKFNYKFDSNIENPKLEAKEFAKYVSGKTPEGQNFLQKKGREGVYKQLGATTQKGTLDYTGKFDEDLNIMDSALNFYDLPRNAEGLSKLPSKIGDLRSKLLSDSGKKFVLNHDEMATPEVVDYIKRTVKNGTQLSDEQIKSAFIDQLNRALPTTKRGVHNTISNKQPVSPEALQNIKDSTKKAYNKYVSGKKELTADEMAQAMLWQAADSKLRSGITGYSKINDTFETLYKQNDGFRQAYDTGLKGAKIASPQDAYSVIANKIGEKFSQAQEKVGDVLAGNVPMANKLPQGIKNPQTAKAIQKSGDIMSNPILARILAGSQGHTPNINNNLNFGGEPSIPDNITEVEQEDPTRIIEQMLAQGYKPSDIKTLQDIGYLPKGNILTADQKNKLSSVQSSLANLDQLEQAFDTHGSSLPGLGSILNANPFDANRQVFDSQIAVVNQTIAKALEGGKMTDADRAFYLSKLPKAGDSKATALGKIAVLREGLQEQLNQYGS